MAISSTQLPAAGSQYEILTTTQTWTPPAGYTVFDVFIMGAGGGGSGGGYADNSGVLSAWGGAGGASGFVTRLDRVRITAPVSVTIGTGGAGGAGATPAAPAYGGATGNRGGATYFGSYVAPGGGGGRPATGASNSNLTPSISSPSSDQSICYDPVTGIIYVPRGGLSSGLAQGGSGGSAGGGVDNGIARSSAGGTLGGLAGSQLWMGAWGGGCFVSPSGTTGSVSYVVQRGGLGQKYVGGGMPIYTASGGFNIDPRARLFDDLWWVPGGGGAGLGSSGVAASLYTEGGRAGTSTSGGKYGDYASATLIDMTGQSATDYGCGGGGGGSSWNTGVAGGNGGAGANGAVIIYYGN